MQSALQAKADFFGHRPNRHKAASSSRGPSHDLHLRYLAHDRAIFTALTEAGARRLRAWGYCETDHVSAYLLSCNSRQDLRVKVSGCPSLKRFAKAVLA